MKVYKEYDVIEYATFREMLDGSVEDYNGKPLFREKADGGIRDTGCGEFVGIVNSLGAAFLQLGLLGGGKIAVVGETSVKWIAAYFAAVCGRGVIVPVDKELPVEEMAYIINDSEARAIVYSPTMLDEMKALERLSPGLSYFIGMEAADESGKWLSFDALAGNVRDGLIAEYASIAQDAKALSTLLYTSGTTGQSKGVMLCQRNILSAAIGGLKRFRVGATSMAILPIHHVFEMTHGVVEMIINRTTVCISDSLRYFMQNLHLYKPEAMFVVPAFVQMVYKKIWAEAQANGQEDMLNGLIEESNRLLESGVDRRAEMFQFIRDAFGGNFNRMLCAGAPLDPLYVKFFREIGIILLQGYGLTETSPLATATHDEDIVDSSAGTPIYCCDVIIDRPDENGEGEILVKGDNVMLGYYKNEEATKAVFTDGWFRTGDVGRMDEDGFLFVTGRVKNLIILSNGKNIYPEEVEGYYMKIPYIREIVVYAPETGEKKDQLCADVFVDEALRREKGDAGMLELLRKDVAEINKKLPGYKRVHNLSLRDVDFEKTTKKTIKRHAVKTAL